MENSDRGKRGLVMGTKSKVIELNDRKTLEMIRIRVEKRAKNGCESDRDTMLLMSIVHRHLNCVLATVE